MRCVAAVSLLIAAAALPVRAELLPGWGEYQVEEGETCIPIAKKLWPGDPAALDRLHALNPELGPTPHELKAGQRLRVRASADARLTFLKPDVNRRAHEEPAWSMAEQGQPLFRLDEVSTLRGAGAEVTFRDASKVQLDENALIVIYGNADQSKVTQTKKSGAIELVQGDLAVKLAQLRGEGFGVQTPGALVNAKAHEVRVGVGADKSTRVVALGGTATVIAQGRTVELRDGQGLSIPPDAPPEEPRALPPAPEWDGVPVDARLAAGPKGASTVVSFKVAPGVARLRVQVARDDTFNDRVLDWSGPASPRLRARVDALAPGSYVVRALTIDAHGLSSPPSPLGHLVVEAGPTAAESKP